MGTFTSVQRKSENVPSMDGPTIAVFTGNANPALAQDIARHLQLPLGRAHVGRFSDGEVTVEVYGERARAATSSSCSPPARR